jgi:hypothetical protein
MWLVIISGLSKMPAAASLHFVSRFGEDGLTVSKRRLA